MSEPAPDASGADPVDDLVGATTPDDAAASAPEVPAPVRALLVQSAADVLGALEPVAVPASLRAVHRFAPRRRASAGAAPLWAALQEPGFRAKVAHAWAVAHADDPLVDPSWEAAAGAWLAGDDDWAAHVPAQDAGTPDAATVARLRTDLERARAEADRLRARLEGSEDAARAAADELAALQRELRRLRSDADRARSEGRRAVEEAAAVLTAAQEARDAAARDRADAAADRRAADAERESSRAELRAGRKLTDARVRLLLDTILDGAAGLRAELALPPAADRPADLVAPAPAPRPGSRAGSRGRSADDPALLDDLLHLPHAHLVVDGYNVSKTGFGELTLAEQRHRLVDGLARVVARTGAEVTVCFDGQEGQPPPGGYARGVRVLFSVGEIADDLIRRLVHAEPPGRVVVVVSSDRSVAVDVEAAGAWAVPSATLVARLQRL